MMHKKLKIAIVSDAIYPYNKGGKEKRIHEISTRLANLGHDVHIYCMKWWNGKEKERVEDGVHLHAISRLYPLYSGKRRSIEEAIFFSLACFQLLREDFDVIDVDHMPHLVLFSTKIVSLLKGKKLFATWSEVWGRAYWIEYLGLLGNIAYFVEWISARLPDAIIAVSQHTKDKLVIDLKVKKNIFLAPNGIDVDLIQSIQPAKESSDVIFAGRLLSHKNIDILVKAIALVVNTIPKIKVIIIGDGPEKTNLAKLIQELHLEANITLLPFLKEQNDVYSLMKASKVFVFPSTREGFGIAALEANACYIPVITTDAKDNATKYLIQNGKNGFVTELSSEKLAEKMMTILSTKKNEMDNLTFSLAKKYDWNLVAHKIERAYVL